ncbi:MAG: hypothetical protein ACKVOP_14350 [Sphingomonadaceae bacterium]
MMKSLWIALGVLLATPVYVAKAESTATVAAPDVADEISTAMAPREQLRSFILRTLQTTTSGAIISQKLGAEKAASVISYETDKMVTKYGGEWAAALASAYRETLSAAELSDALAAVRARDQAKMMPFLLRVGPVMQANATPLLQKASAEALSNAFARPEMK